MSKIETLEQLQEERRRLLLNIESMEANLSKDASELAQQFQPLVDTLSFIENKARLIVPISKAVFTFFSPKKKSSVWKTVAIMAMERILSRANWNDLGNMLSGMYKNKKE